MFYERGFATRDRGLGVALFGVEILAFDWQKRLYGRNESQKNLSARKLCVRCLSSRLVSSRLV